MKNNPRMTLLRTVFMFCWTKGVSIVYTVGTGICKAAGETVPLDYIVPRF